MAAHSPSLQSTAVSSLGLAAGLLGLVALGALGGLALALGELQSLWVALSVIAGLAILVDFRIGAVLLALLLPISDTTLFPHALLGVTGLNPINLLMAATLLSYVLRGRLLAASGALVPKQLVWLFCGPADAALFPSGAPSACASLIRFGSGNATDVPCHAAVTTSRPQAPP